MRWVLSTFSSSDCVPDRLLTDCAGMVGLCALFFFFCVSSKAVRSLLFLYCYLSSLRLIMIIREILLTKKSWNRGLDSAVFACLARLASGGLRVIGE